MYAQLKSSAVPTYAALAPDLERLIRFPDDTGTRRHQAGTPERSRRISMTSDANHTSVSRWFESPNSLRWMPHFSRIDR